MAQKEDIRQLDGRTMKELGAAWDNSAGSWADFLARHAGQHPWFVGIAAIVAIVLWGPIENNGMWLSLVSVLLIALITLVSAKPKVKLVKRPNQSGGDASNEEQNRRPATPT